MNFFDTPSGVPSSTKLSAEESSFYESNFNKLLHLSTTSNSPFNDVLIKYLTSSALTQATLTNIWELSGGTAKGTLGSLEFQIACKLVALTQNGMPASLENLGAKSPLAQFSLPLPSNSSTGSSNGGGANNPPSVFTKSNTTSSLLDSFSPISSSIPLPSSTTTTTQAIPTQVTGTAAVLPTATGSSPQGLVCTAEEKQRFTSFFEASGPVDGYLQGNTAKEIFLKSQLPPETLSKVWNLVDKDKTGKFSLNHFCVAMWIITKLKLGLFKEVPTFIPPSLWNSIVNNGVSGPTSAFTVPTSSATPAPPPTSLLSDITDQEKAQYSSYFDTLDSSKKGSVSGGECSTLFLKSKLPAAELAQIWDLVDAKKSGFIDKNRFTLAMHLIKKRMAGASIPSKQQPVATTPGSAVAAAPPIQQPLPQASLMDFDTDSNTTPAFSSKPFKPTQDSTSAVSSPSIKSNVPSSNPPSSVFTSLALNPSTSSTQQQQPVPVPAGAVLNNPIFAPKQSTTSTVTLESKDLETREQTLQTRHQELQMLTTQLQDLKPTAEQVKKRREQVDKEYRKTTEARNQVSIELSQLRAQYELDLETLRDRQGMLDSDTRTLKAAQQEIVQYQEAISLITKENAVLADKIEKQKIELNAAVKLMSELEGETATLRQATHKLFDEARQQHQQMEQQSRALESSKQEHHIVKQNLEIEQNRLEQDKKKVQLLEQQASVQYAITMKEKERFESMEKERRSALKKSEELLNSMEVKSKSIENLKVDRDQILARAVSEEDVVIPTDEPAPPLPPPSTKPERKSVTENPISTLQDLGSKPLETVLSATSSTGAALQTPASTFSVESSISKKERESLDLDSLLSSNRPKTPKALHEEPKHSKADLDSFFGATSTTVPSTKAKTDVSELMDKAFATTTLKQAKDTPSLAGTPGTSGSKSLGGGGGDAFTFSNAFSAPLPTQSKQSPAFNAPSDPFGAGSDFGDFKQGSSAALGFGSGSKTAQKIQDLDSVFGASPVNSAPPPASFGGDPFGGQNTSGFGSNPFDAFTSSSAAPSGASMGFDDAFSAPPPAVTTFKSPAPQSLASPTDSQEVQDIVAMGFTPEQAKNALEAHGYVVERAINYLLESGGK